jgi:hypothetical protein
MRRPRLSRTTCFLLSILLLASAVAPPAVRHAHPLAAGGEVHHRHDANRELHGGHHHDTDHADDHLQDQYAGGCLSSSDHFWHLHVPLLGLTLALPETASDENDCDSNDTDTVFLPGSNQELLSCQAAPSASLQQIIGVSLSTSPYEAALMQVVVSAPAPVSCAPLCDRARRERSGVLIA